MKNLSIGIFLIICTLKASNIQAQVNIEQYREKTSMGAHKNQTISVSTSIAKNKTNYYSIGIKYIRNFEITPSYQGFFITKVHYGERNNTEYINDSFYHLRFINNNSFYGITPELYGQYEQNKFSATQYRYVAGIGGRYSIIEKIIGGTSILYESYEDEDNVSNQQVLRLSQYLTIDYDFNSNNTLSSTVYLQPAIENFSNIRTTFEIIYLSQLTNTIGYTSTFSGNYFSENTVYDYIELYFESGLTFKI